MNPNIRPLPEKVGVGFLSPEKLEANGYREERAAHVWHYFFTPERWNWPLWDAVENKPSPSFKIDAFSPNLNKSLHFGHLRQLALAHCIGRLLPRTQFVSLLGCTGILQSAQDELQEWFSFLNMRPKLYYDALMPHDPDIVPRHEGEGEKAGAMVWDGPNGPVVVMRKPDESGYRRPTYAFHDLAFAKVVGPDFYITGAEQVEHFRNLGLGNKHLSMGLVVDAEGKKLKSRSGEAMSAKEGFAAVEQVMKPVPDPKKIIWNVIAWNMLSSGRATNVKFEPEKWVKPEAPGMYCSYTWARLYSALGGLYRGDGEDMTQSDAELAGFSQYRHYYIAKARATMDPAPLANYLYDLCRRATKAYHTERIRDGRRPFQFAVSHAMNSIYECMQHLGMFPIKMREEEDVRDNGAAPLSDVRADSQPEKPATD